MYTSTCFDGLNQEEGLGFTDVMNTGFQAGFFVCVFWTNVDYNMWSLGSNIHKITVTLALILFNPLFFLKLKWDRNEYWTNIWNLVVFSCDATDCTQIQDCQPWTNAILPSLGFKSVQVVLK